MRIIKIVSCIIIAAIISSCSIDEKEVIGVYASENLINNIDSLFINLGGKYNRKLYSKKTGALILSHGDNWSYKENKITLNDYFLDTDRQYTLPHNFTSSRMTCEFDMKILNDTIGIYNVSYDRTFIYKKVK